MSQEQVELVLAYTACSECQYFHIRSLNFVRFLTWVETQSKPTTRAVCYSLLSFLIRSIVGFPLHKNEPISKKKYIFNLLFNLVYKFTNMVIGKVFVFYNTVSI